MILQKDKRGVTVKFLFKAVLLKSILLLNILLLSYPCFCAASFKNKQVLLLYTGQGTLGGTKSYKLSS